MKVGFLVGSVSREAGGLFQSVRGLAKAIIAKNVNATAFGIRDPNTALDAHEWRPVAVRTFHSQFPPWGYSSHLVGALVAADLDILSSHGLWKYSSVASLRWHRRTGRPYIVHPHGMLEPWALQNAKWKKRIAARLYEDKHLRGAACLRALCEPEAQSIRDDGVRNAICVIPNGVELPETLQNAVSGVKDSELTRAASGRKVLLYLGRLHPKKNLPNLIRAWKKIVGTDRLSDQAWLLAIAGWGENGYERELNEQASEDGLTSSVRLLGPLFGSDKDAAYRACDACILPSLSEGLPMSVLEAWAYAKPVLMTRECNLPEGFAAEAALQIGTRPEEIAAGLKRLSEMSDEDRKAMGDRGRALVSTRFSWTEIGRQMRAVYDWILGGGSPPEMIRLH
jgi:glycosyltransferase involved in cell wall biosynthesis